MQEQKVKYYKTVFVENQRIDERVVKETTGTLLKICDDGSMMIKNDLDNRIDIVPKLETQFFVKFI